MVQRNTFVSALASPMGLGILPPASSSTLLLAAPARAARHAAAFLNGPSNDAEEVTKLERLQEFIKKCDVGYFQRLVDSGLTFAPTPCTCREDHSSPVVGGWASGFTASY